MDEATKAHIPADKAVVAVFSHKDAAERAYMMLKEMDYSEEDISILMSDEAHLMYFNAPHLHVDVKGSSITEPTAVAAAVGVGAGSLLGGALVAAVTVAFPGIGLVIVGPLTASLIGAGFGGLTGGLLGSLIGVGIPDSAAKSYEEKIKEGKIIIGVTPRNDLEQEKIITAWGKAGGELIVH